MLPISAENAAIHERSGYAPRAFDPKAVVLALLIQGAILAIVLTHRFPVAEMILRQPLVVHSVELTPPPPAEPEVERLPEPVPPEPAIHAPRPPLELPALNAPALVTTPEPLPAPTPAPVSAPSPAPPVAPAQPVSAGDLSASMIHAPPPRYPRESRRLREQGTVILELLLASDGTVRDIRVARSSGHARLDEAARGAVSRWRWSPTTRNGVAVQVRGTVEIPFVLTAP